MVPMTRWLIVGLSVALMAAACGPSGTETTPPELGTEDGVEETPDPEPDPPDEEAEESVEEPTEPADDADGPPVEVYFVRVVDAGIWVEPEVHVLAEPTTAVAQGALDILFAGEPHDPSLTTAVPEDTALRSLDIRDRVLVIDVTADILGHSAGSSEEIAFAQQLAHTVASFPTVDAISLWIDGEPIDELWGHLDWSEPLEPDPFALSPITIAEPRLEDGRWTAPAGPIVLRGEATVFEATFGIRVIGPGGDVLVDDVVTATQGGPERGTWEYRLDLDEPGNHLVVVFEEDPSDGEGRPPFELTRTLEVE